MKNNEELNTDKINVRLPSGMKEQLKQKLGWNMSKIMKETFQDLLDKDSVEKKNLCLVCKKQIKFNDCKFTVITSDEEATFYIFCKDCITQPINSKTYKFNDDNKDMLNLLELIRINAVEMSEKIKHNPEQLENLYNMGTTNPEVCRIGEGIVTMKKSNLEKQENIETGNAQ